MECYLELSEQTPLSEEAYADYQPTKERIQEANYKLDLELVRLKRSL